MGWKRKKTTFHSRRFRACWKERVKNGCRWHPFYSGRQFLSGTPLLSGRPRHRSAAEKVDVDVVYGLTAIFSCIDHGAIAL